MNRKFHPLTSFFVGALIFAGCAYTGYRATVRLVYRYRQSAWFSVLGKQEAREFRAASAVLFFYQPWGLSSARTVSSLQRDAEKIAMARRIAPEEVRPILDLRLAKDYVALSRLEQQTGRPEAVGHKQLAADLLHSLGWRDVSDPAMAALADRELRSSRKK